VQDSYEQIEIDEALQRGFWMVGVPSLATLVVPLLTYAVLAKLGHVPSIGYPGMKWALPIFFGSIAGSWLVWSVQVPRWRLWAYRRVGDIQLLKRAAAASQLIWREGSIFERTEIMSRSVRGELKRLEEEQGRTRAAAPANADAARPEERITAGARPMSADERGLLQRILEAQSNRRRRWKSAAGNFVVLWAGSLLAAILIWLLVAWLMRFALHWNVGWGTPAAIWVVGLGALGCAVFSAFSTARWVKSWPDHRSELAADLAGGVVVEEPYRLVAAKLFQEPEHGGLMYFLRTEDGDVLVLYDHESGSLGARGENPLASTFRPLSRLILVRAPSTKFVLDSRFSGAPIEVPAPVELAVPPSRWPDDEKFCDIPWEELERRLGAKKPAAQ